VALAPWQVHDHGHGTVVAGPYMTRGGVMGPVVQGAGHRRAGVLEPTLRALARYAAAVADHEAQDSIASSDALLEARLLLLQTLVHEGWRPSDRIADALSLDGVVAHLGLGAASAFEDLVPAQHPEGVADR
jgi:hypothetical protein